MFTAFLSHPKFFRQTLFLLILFPPFFPNNADGQLLQGIRRLELPDPCLANLPTPKVIPPAIRVVQLVNCSGQTVLGAANAANATGKPITSVFPVEKTWVMKPFPSPNHGNVLTIQIPPEWADTKGIGSIAPNIWVRTGCRFDVASDKAQCETGGAGGVYDTSKARLGPPGATTITEWTFYQAATSTRGTTYYVDNFDISAVNGVSLTVDIQQVGGSPADPGSPQNIFWLTNSRVERSSS